MHTVNFQMKVVDHCKGPDNGSEHCKGPYDLSVHCKGLDDVSAYCKGPDDKSAHCKGPDDVSAYCKGPEDGSEHCKGPDDESSHCKACTDPLHSTMTGQLCVACRGGGPVGLFRSLAATRIVKAQTSVGARVRNIVYCTFNLKRDLYFCNCV